MIFSLSSITLDPQPSETSCKSISRPPPSQRWRILLHGGTQLETCLWHRWARTLCQLQVCFEHVPLQVDTYWLSAIASSYDVKCAFSHGSLTISKYRHALSDESTRAATLLNSWSQVPGLIPDAEIIQDFKDKSRRLRKKKQGSSTSMETATDDGMDIDDSVTSSIEILD